MENVILIIHLIIAVLLIGAVLLQRSEGGALGMGGGGGGGMVSSRGAATAMTKLTWGLAAGFIATSLILTILAAENRSSSSILDGVAVEEPTDTSADAPVAPKIELPKLDGAPATPPQTEDQAPASNSAAPAQAPARN